MITLLKKFLLTIGIFVLGFYALLAYQLMGAGPGEMSADHPDIARIESLLGGTQIEILNSYEISGNWSGDIDRGFAGRINDEDLRVLQTLDFSLAGDELDPSMQSAVRFLADHVGGDQTDWFPSAEEILTDDFRVRTLAAESQGGGLDSSRLLILQPEEGMVFYGWVKF